MCYRVSRDFTDVDVRKTKEFGVTKVLSEFLSSYNVTITQKIPVIVPGSRILDLYQWGLIPHWANDSRIGDKLANARSETLLEKPMFRDSFKKKRCLVLVSGFFEWDKNKNPYYIQVKEKKIFALAGLYDEWKDEDGKIIKTATVITCEPNSFIKKLHNRMPVILSSENYDKWLTSDDINEVQKLLKPFDDNLIYGFEVTRKANSVKNNSPDILLPIDSNKSGKESQRKLM